MSQRLKILGTLLMAVFASASLAEASMIAHWNFDEGSGTTCADVTGNGHVGTLSDATWEPGVAGSAVTFDGTDNDSKVAIADSSDQLSAGDLRSGGGWSFATWVRMNEISGSRSLIYSTTDAQNFMFLRVMQITGTTSGRLRFHYEIADDRKFSDYSSSAPDVLIQPGEWTHVAVVLNADAPIGSQLKFFVNGTDATANGDIDLASASLSLPASVKTLGYEPTYGEINGSLDDARFYNHALTPAEIQTLIPEPATLALLMMATGALLLRPRGK